MSEHPSNLRVLIVDDDHLTLKTVELILKNKGYRTHTALNVTRAESILEELGTDHFDAVITDYRMPDKNGLELIDWINKEDNTLSAILLTGEGEKKLVANALRSGASDFLEKPFVAKDIIKAVGEAIEKTLHNRSVAATVTDIQAVSGIHEQLAQGQIKQVSEAYGNKIETIVRSFPIKETGGDFGHIYPMDNQKLFVMAGDVSGHDLKAGYISAYFQGIVRGMVHIGADLEMMCEFFNNFLVKEWNVQTNTDDALFIRTSLSACLLEFDFTAGKVKTLNNGLPLVYMNTNLELTKAISKNSPPLGWYPKLPHQSVEYDLGTSGYSYLWSDGVADFAYEHNLSAFAIAHRMMTTTKEDFLEAMGPQPDDIIAIRIGWGQDTESPACPCILYQTCKGDEVERVDSYQECWENSLKFALPGIDPDRIQQILLCCREGILNAMKHGCEQDAKKSCNISIYYNEKLKQVKAIVTDPGLGYDYEPDIENPKCSEDGHVSFGLILITHHADTLHTEHNGATLIMEFNNIFQSIYSNKQQ